MRPVLPPERLRPPRDRHHNFVDEGTCARHAGGWTGRHRDPARTFANRRGRDEKAFLFRLALRRRTAAAGSGCTVISDLIGSEKRDVYKFDHPFTVKDPAFRRSLDTFGTAMVPGNTAELLKNGDQIFPAMTEEIRRAKKTVNLETYIFQPDEAGRQFADAMIDAANRGVEVRLLIDAWGSKVGDLRDQIEKAGSSLAQVPPRPPLLDLQGGKEDSPEDPGRGRQGGLHGRARNLQASGSATRATRRSGATRRCG